MNNVWALRHSVSGIRGLCLRLFLIFVISIQLAADLYASDKPNVMYVGTQSGAGIFAYTIDPATGALSPIAGSPFSTGVASAAVSVAPSGKFAYVTNFPPGSCTVTTVSGYQIDPETAALSPVSGSPFPAGSGAVWLTTDGRFMYVANWCSNAVSGFSVNSSSGSLTTIPGSPFPTGNGPQAVALDPSGHFAYVTNTASDSISAYTINAITGALSSIFGSPFPTGATPESTLALDPTGRFAYLANQNSNNVSAFQLDAVTGALVPVPGNPFVAGTGPEAAVVDRSGHFLYVPNWTSNNISAYSINSATGALTPVSGSPFAAGTNPYFAAVEPSGDFLYVTNYTSGDVSGYRIDANTGALTPLNGSPFRVANGPDGIDFVDRRPLTVTIEQRPDQQDPTSESTIHFQVVFSRLVTGFATGDVIVAGTAGATTAVVSGSGSTYDVAVTGMTQSGTVIATVPVGVAFKATSGEPNVASTSSDNTVTFNALPDLTITKTHTGHFVQGQTAALYSLAVKNIGLSASTGQVTVTESLPSSLSLTSMSGTGWTCTNATCTRSDTLQANQSYPGITVSVTVATDAPVSITNTASVAGGGEANQSNDTATDTAVVDPAAIAIAGGTVISSTTAWTITTSPYVIGCGGVTISSTGTLTISAGAVIKFATGCGNWIDVVGSLNANGTVTAPIVFTSLRDDSVSGDTNGDGTTTTPAKSDWAYIYFESSATGSITNASLRNAGWTAPYGAISIDRAASPAQITLNAITFTNNSIGLGVDGKGAITGSRFENNTYGIYVVHQNSTAPSINVSGSTFVGNSTGFFGGSDVTGTIANNTFTGGTSPFLLESNFLGSLSGNTSTGATFNAARINLGTLSGSALWGQSTMPYVLRCTGFSGIDIRGSLTISPGVIVKFESGCGNDLHVYGSLTANGTSAAPIVFSSLRDDSVGGDTNGDGTASSPAKSDWAWIFFDSASSGSIMNASVRYGGWASPNYGAISVVGLASKTQVTLSGLTFSNNFIGLGVDGGATISDSRFENNTQGILVGVLSSGDLTVDHSVFTQNSIALHVSNPSDTTIHDSDIFGNVFGVQNDSHFLLNARNNFWGAASGPSAAGPGSGDKVSANVDILPFLSSSAFTPQTTGSVFVSYTDPSGGGIIKFENGNQSTFASGGFLTPNAIVFDDQRNLYTSEGGYPTAGAGKIYKFTPDGIRTTFASGINPYGLAIDASGNVYAGDAFANQVYKFTPAGVRTTFATGVSALGLVFDSNGNLFVSDPSPVGGGSPAINMITPGGVKSIFASGLSYPVGLAFDSNGNLYVADSSSSGTIYVFTPAGARTVFAAGLPNSIQYITFDNAGNLYAASGVGSIYKITPDRTVTVLTTITGSAHGVVFNTGSFSSIAPDLTVTKTHSGIFYSGQVGATYSITVNNTGLASSSGTVTLTDAIPSGLSATAISGTGWSCTLVSLTCNRSDVLASGTAYPPITVTVNVANNAPPLVTNTATVAGGGETNTANNSGSDPTNIVVPTVVFTPLSPTFGQSVSVTATGAPSPTAWVGLYVVGSADQSFLDWRYLNNTQSRPSATIPTATVTINAPATPGAYEFRFFADGGFTRIAVSPAFSLALQPPTITGGSTAKGGVGISYSNQSPLYQITATNSPTSFNASGNLPPGISFSTTSGVFTGTPASAAVGSWPFILTATNGAGTSPSFALTMTITNPTLTFSPASASPGQTISVTVSGAPDPSTTDWVAIYPAGDPDDHHYLDWRYLNNLQTAPGTVLSSATITFTAPAAGGNYNFRFFTNNTYNRLTTSSTLSVCANPPAGLVSWWSADNTVSDLEGLSNPSSVSGVTFVPGRVASGFTFGQNGYIEIPSSSSLNNQQFTVSAWVRPDGAGPNNDDFGSVVVQKASGLGTGEAAVALWWRATDGRFSLASGSTSTQRVVSQNAFPTGTFYHVVGTYDGATLKLYVNGALEAQLSKTGSVSYTSVPWTIGSSYSEVRAAGFPRTWNGVIDEVQIFNRSLTGAEIQGIVSADSAGECKGPPPDLTVTKNHSGNFDYGRTGTYTVTVSNVGQGPSYGTTTATDSLPAGFTATDLSGTGWMCTLSSVSCSRNDVLQPGTSYPPILLTVTVTPAAAAQVTNVASVSGGGDLNTANNTANDVTSINPPPDLTVTKTHAGIFYQGQTAQTFTLTVRNSGTGPTFGTVTVRDILPAGLTATNISGTGWTCVIAAVSCSRSDALAANSSYAPVSVTVEVAANATGSPSNIATVSGGSQQNTGNDTALDQIFILVPPDLVITKTHNGTAAQGQHGLVYLLTVSNNGNAATSTSSSTVNVIDALPAGLSATSITGDGWTCALATLACTRADVLAAHSSYPVITITVDVANNAPASLTNVASVSGGGELKTTNNSASDVTTIISAPDLTLVKSHSGNFTAGQVGATYTVLVTNLGSAPTTGAVTVSDIVPSGLTVTALTGIGWNCSIANLSCTRADVLTGGGSFPAITVTVTVSSTAPNPVTNTATVSGGGEFNTSNNSSSDVTAVSPPPDLAVNKTHGSAFIFGQTGATYTITVTNIGQGVTHGEVTVVDTLPSGLTATAISGTNWNCTLASLTCTRSDSLAAGAAYPTITLAVNVAGDAVSPVTNTATVTGGGDQSLTNNVSSDITAILRPPDLTLTKTHIGNFVQGQIGATYSIVARNTGGVSTTSPVTVTDILPAGLSATNITGSGWNCVIATLTCSRADALAAASAYPAITLTVNVDANSPLTVTNTATVAGGGEQSVGNNNATDVTTIGVPADLTITETHGGNFKQGQSGATYAIIVTNIGGGATSGTVSVADVMPVGLSATSISGNGWTCNTGSLSCSRADSLSAGASYPPITITVNVASHAASPVINTATVSGGAELNVGNDTATDSTIIDIAPDLSLTKTHNGIFTRGQAGGVYTLNVSNVGGSATSGLVTVIDNLPVGLVASSIAGAGWNCSLETLTCTRSDVLAAGTNYPAITLNVIVATTAENQVTNTATVSNASDLNTNNNIASDSVSTSSPADLSIVASHTGNFVQGQIGAGYSITVRNIGTVATAGTITVIDTLPAGLTATAISGAGWTCSLATLTCSRSDALASGAAYPVITLITNVAADASSPVVNSASVTGGGDVNSGNNTAVDQTAIFAAVPMMLPISGDGQSATIGRTLAAPFVVRVTSSTGLPLMGVPITFTILSGNGTINGSAVPFVVNTDSAGFASATLALGPAVAINVVQATSPGISGPAAVFSATGIGALVLTSGENQVGIVGNALPAPFVVTALGKDSAPITNLPVTFQVTAGGGSLSAATVSTNSDGQAAVFLTPGPAGGTNAVNASASGLTGSPVTFHAVGNPVSSLRVDPAPADFGGVTVATAATKTLTIFSTGVEPVTVNNLSISGAFYSLMDPPAMPLVIPPSGSRNFVVQFKPLASASVAGSVSISSSASSQAFNVPLSGTGLAAPLPAITGITIVTDKSGYKRGQPVTITGRATSATGNGIPNIPVQISIGSRGSTRTLNPYTDFQGSYQATFIPNSSEAGSYTLAATAASGGSAQTAVANFRIVGMLLAPSTITKEMVMGANATMPIDIQNIGDWQLSNISYSATVLPSGSMTVNMPASGAILNPGANVSSPIVLTAPAVTPPPNGAVMVKVTVTATDAPSGIVSQETTTINVTLHPAVSTPVLIPSPVNIGVNAGRGLTATLYVRNDGFLPMANATVSLQNPNGYSWIDVVNPSLGSIDPAELKTFQLRVYPPTTAALGDYAFTLNVAGGTTPLQVPVTVSVTALTVGTATFAVSDDTGARVSGGTVTLIGGTTGRNYQTATTSEGAATISGVEAGTYSYIVTAPSHKPSVGTVTVTPAATASSDVVMVYDVVSLTFTVTPTAIVDVYDVTLNVTYKTSLPKPALQVLPYKLQLSFYPEDVPSGRYPCTFTVTNTHPTAPVRNVLLDASRLDGSLPEGQRIHVWFADNATTYSVEGLAAHQSVDVACYATVDNGGLPTHSAGSLVVQADYDYSADGQVKVGTTTSEVPVNYIRPDDLSFRSVSYVYDKRTDPQNPVLRYESGSYVQSVKSNRNVTFDIRKPQETPFNGQDIVAFIETERGATDNDTINLNQTTAFWHTNFDAQKRTLYVSGDSTSFDISVPDGNLSLQDALQARIASDPDTTLTKPTLLAFRGRWTDLASDSTYLVPVTITTITPDSIYVPQPPKLLPQGGGITCLTIRECADPEDGVGPPSITTGGQIQMAIDQTIKLERQAYNADLKIDVRTTLENTFATVQIREMDGTDATAKFFTVVTSDVLGATHGGNVPSSTVVSWQLIPNGSAGGTSPLGRQYKVQATLQFTVNGVAKTAVTQEVTITVLPAPKLQITYTAPYVVMPEKDIYLRVNIKNVGYGTAHNLTIESEQPRIVSTVSDMPLDQLLLADLLGIPVLGPNVDFTLTGSSNTADGLGLQPANLAVSFGDVAPGATVEGFWIMRVSKAGFFIDISSTFTHQDYLGVKLDPLILNPTVSLVPAIGGTVKTLNGKALSAMTVTVSQGGVMKGKDQTDHSGNYYIPDLVAGTYLAEVRDLSGALQDSRNITVLGDQGTNFIDFAINFAPTKAIVVIGKDNPGLTVTVEGPNQPLITVTTPRSFIWDIGQAYNIGIDETQGDNIVAGWDDGESNPTRTLTVTEDGAVINPVQRSAADVRRYDRRQLTFGNKDHKWPATNNLGDIVWSEKDNDGYWQVFLLSRDGLTQSITSGARNHERPAISDDGTIGWFEDNSGGGLGYSIIRRDPGGALSTVEFSNRNSNCVVQNVGFGVVFNTGICRYQEHAAGKTFGISSTGKTISFYTQFESGAVSARRFNVTGIGKIANNASPDSFPGYESPDINRDMAIVYADGFPRQTHNIYLATASNPYATTLIGEGQSPHISDSQDVVYIKSGINVTRWPGQQDWVGLGLWADIGGSGDSQVIAYECIKNGISQVCVATPRKASINGKDLGDCMSCEKLREGKEAIGDPIDVATGNLYEQVLDYTTVGPNPLSFTRYYNSLANIGPEIFAKTFGLNWRGSYDRFIRLGPSTASVERADGRVLSFKLTGNVWTSDSDVDLKLTQAGSTWTLTGADDAVDTYTAISSTKAVLSKIQTRSGYVQTLNYNSAFQLTSVTDSFGRSLAFTYNTSGFLRTMSTPDNQIFTYDYDSTTGAQGPLDRLVSVSFSTVPATKRTYLYENPTYKFAMTGLIDENGKRFATWTYDGEGRATSSQHAGGVDRTTITYNADGSRTETNALGLQVIHKFTALQGVQKLTQLVRVATPTTASATITKTYDSNGYLSSETDWNGNRIDYVNDSRGLPLSVTEAAGTPQARTMTTTFDPVFHLPLSVVTPGLTTTFTYDVSGNLLTRKETDTTTTTVPYSTAGSTRIWTNTWTGPLLTSVRGPLNDVTTFTYDATGTLTAVTNALNQVTRTTQHTAGGRPLTTIDPNGVVTQFAYDARLRLISSAVSTAAGTLTTSYSYDAAGNLLRTTLPDGSAVINTYDDAQRLVSVADVFGQRTAYTLDAMGNRIETKVFDAAGTLTHSRGATFDALGRIISEVGGVAQTTRFVFDNNGNDTSITDALGRVTQQTFDPLNRRVRITDAASGVTTSSYDSHDRPLSVTAPNGAVTTYVYNGFGNVIQTLSPDTGKTVYRYDAAGNLTQKIDAANATVNYAYDLLSRVLTATYPTAAAENVTYRYDEAGHGFGIGRLTSVTDPVGTLSRSYDERGNLTSERRIRGTVTKVTTYSYDSASRTASIGYPSGATVGYNRDAMGRVTGVTLKPNAAAPVAPVVGGIIYQPFGPISSLVFGNGVTETRTFDNDYRITNLSDTGSLPVQGLSYNYDAVDNVRSIVDTVKPVNSQNFTYDALDRLLTANGGVYGNLTYTYDSVGNRLSQQAGSTLTTYVYTANSNRLTQVKTGTATQVLSYTPAGNITTMANVPSTKPATGISYNQSARLAQVLAGGAIQMQYTYDAFGQRLVKTGAVTGTSIYQYDKAGHLLEDSDGLGATRVDYIYLDDRPIATYQPPTNKTYYLHDDRLGTPQVATDAAQLIAWKADYEPFGATNTGIGTIAQNLRLPGQEFEAETGWNHNGFRDYIPGVGRYLESDLIGMIGGVNSYTYVHANPSRWRDPSGLLTKQEKTILIIGASVGLVASGAGAVAAGAVLTEEALTLGGAAIATSEMMASLSATAFNLANLVSLTTTGKPTPGGLIEAGCQSRGISRKTAALIGAATDAALLFPFAANPADIIAKMLGVNSITYNIAVESTNPQ